MIRIRGGSAGSSLGFLTSSYCIFHSYEAFIAYKLLSGMKIGYFLKIKFDISVSKYYLSSGTVCRAQIAQLSPDTDSFLIIMSTKSTSSFLYLLYLQTTFLESQQNQKGPRIRFQRVAQAGKSGWATKSTPIFIHHFYLKQTFPGLSRSQSN